MRFTLTRLNFRMRARQWRFPLKESRVNAIGRQWLGILVIWLPMVAFTAFCLLKWTALSLLSDQHRGSGRDETAQGRLRKFRRDIEANMVPSTPCVLPQMLLSLIVKPPSVLLQAISDGSFHRYRAANSFSFILGSRLLNVGEHSARSPRLSKRPTRIETVR